jgi:transcriptional regulator with XRE-family HTH domain
MVSPSIRFPAGSTLREARERQGLTLEHAGVGVGRSAQTIQLYELGKVRPPRSVLVRLAHLLDVPLSELDAVERLLQEAPSPTIEDPAVLAQVAAILRGREDDRGTA